MTKLKSSARNRRSPKTLIPLASLLITLTVSGCSGTRSCLSSVCAPYEASKGSCTTERQARRCARAIWDSHHAQCYLNNCHYKEVREGFIAGFTSVCNGGNTCPPMFAPTKHSLCGLNKRCSTAWHEGWPLGAIAAESSGFCNSCCSRAHPCLRGPRVPCNPGCVSCGSGSDEYASSYIVDSYQVSEAPEEAVEVQIEVAPPVVEEHPYEAPIELSNETAEAVAVPVETAPAPPAALPPPTPAPEPKAQPLAPPKETTQLLKPLRLHVQSAKPTLISSRPVKDTSRSIAGIQDAEARIANLIERFQPDTAE